MKDKVLVLVDTMVVYRMRYCVEVPKDHPEYALDVVTMGDANEFSQLFIDENILSSRVVTEDEAIQIFDEDNDYLIGATRERKIEIGITKEEDYK